MNPLKVELHAQVTFADAQAIIVRFFRWWGGELFTLLPAHWRAAHERWNRRFTLREDGRQWTVAEDERPAFAFDASLADEVLREALASEAPEIFARPMDVALSPDDVLIRRIELPGAATSRLRSTIGLQIERLSPFRAEDVGFDCHVADRNEVSGTAQVEVCIVPRKTMRRFEDRLERLGLTADWFRVGDAPFRVRSESGVARDSSLRRLGLIVSAAAAMLWLGVVIFTPIARELDIASMTDQIAELKPEADRALALKSEVQALREPARLAAAKAAQARPIDVLKSLSALLPDSVRLLELSIEGRHVTVGGVAASAPALVGVLEKSGVFRSVHFRTPVVRRPDGNDRFELEMIVASRARPDTT